MLSLNANNCYFKVKFWLACSNCLCSVLQVSSDAKNECREKTVVFAADDEFMEMTGCHTVNIACGPLVPEEKSADIDKENLPLNTTQNVREPFKAVIICPELTMDMTEAQTGHVLEGVQDDPFQFLFPPQDMYTHCLKKADGTSGQRISEALKSSNHKGKVLFEPCCF